MLSRTTTPKPGPIDWCYVCLCNNFNARFYCATDLASYGTILPLIAFICCAIKLRIIHNFQSLFFCPDTFLGYSDQQVNKGNDVNYYLVIILIFVKDIWMNLVAKEMAFN